MIPQGWGRVRWLLLLVAIASVAAVWAPAMALADTTVEAESMSLPDGGVHVFSDATASGGKALNFTSNDTATTTVATEAATVLTLRARGDQCQGAPEAVVSIDGKTVFTVLVPAISSWTLYSTSVAIAAGTHTIALTYDNDLYLQGICDRNLRVDDLVLSGGPAMPPPAPTGLVATPGNAQVALAWNAVTSVGIAGYNVFRATTSGGPYTQLTSTPVPNPAYLDTTAANGTTYYYVVQAVNTAGQSSPNSGEVSARPLAPTGTSTTIEAESMSLPDGGVHVFNDPLASGGQALNFTSNDTASATVSTVAASTLILRARGDQCEGAPEAVVKIDGANVFTVLVPATSWSQYTTNLTLASGVHTIQVVYDNDLYRAGVCDRNLRLDRLVLNSTGTTATPLLPDFVQEPPSQVSVVQSGASYRLGFNSGVENHGEGPLIVSGHRSSTGSPMVADQILRMSDGSTETLSGIGSMIFYAPHNHWHYLGFDHYELRKASDNSLVAPDQKMGFCLGDRYTPNPDGTRTEPPKVAGPYTYVNCAVGEPNALSVTEGMSVGYGDDYAPQLEGQYIDVTGVAPGQYTIVHRVNQDHSLRESNYTNDAASVLVSLWPNGYGNSPGVEVLKSCPASEACSASASPALSASAGRSVTSVPTYPQSSSAGYVVPVQLIDPPQLLPRTARYFASQAIGRSVRGSVSRLLEICRRGGAIRYGCAVSFRDGSAWYSGEVTVALAPSNGQHWWTYSLRLTRHADGRCGTGVRECRLTIRRAARVAAGSNLHSLIGLTGLPLYFCHPPSPAKGRASH